MNNKFNYDEFQEFSSLYKDAKQGLTEAVAALGRLGPDVVEIANETGVPNFIKTANSFDELASEIREMFKQVQEETEKVYDANVEIAQGLGFVVEK